MSVTSAYIECATGKRLKRKQQYTLILLQVNFHKNIKLSGILCSRQVKDTIPVFFEHSEPMIIFKDFQSSYMTDITRACDLYHYTCACNLHHCTSS